MKKVGLTLGKFYPFHKGHQYLIETALSEVEHLIVMVYDSPEDAKISVEVRANWIRALYPQVEVIEAKGVPRDVGYSEEIQNKHVLFILSFLKGKAVDAFYSSEAYGEKMSQALGCHNRLVDTDRVYLGISGTAIRENPSAFQAYVEPLVYQDLIQLL